MQYASVGIGPRSALSPSGIPRSDPTGGLRPLWPPIALPAYPPELLLADYLQEPPIPPYLVASLQSPPSHGDVAGGGKLSTAHLRRWPLPHLQGRACGLVVQKGEGDTREKAPSRPNACAPSLRSPSPWAARSAQGRAPRPGRPCSSGSQRSAPCAPRAAPSWPAPGRPQGWRTSPA